MDLNDKIKMLMKAQNLTQKELALKANITEASMSKYISGDRTPRLDVVVKIAKALDVSVDDLAETKGNHGNAFTEMSAALARCKQQLSEDDKKKLIKFLLED